MHQPIPAGKLVNFRDEEYYDPKTQKFYQGIYVDVYVSKGAPDIWEMVLDGTLTGFSIGGAVTDAEPQFVKDAGKVIRFIKAYDLVELSLVDSPANQLSNIFSVTKAADGRVSLSGPLSQVVTENVFWCKKDEVAFTGQEDARNCTACNTPAQNIGWFETDGGDKTEKVNAIVADFERRLNNMEKVTDVTDNAEELDEVEAQDEPTPLVVNGEGPSTESGVALGDDTNGDLEDNIEDAAEEKDEEDEAEGEDGPADADEPSDLAGEEDDEADEADDSAEAPVEVDPNFGKMFAELADTLKGALDASADAQEAQLTKVNDKLAVISAVADKVDEFSKTQAEFAEKFAALNAKVEEMENRFKSVEKGVGLKKSGDLGGSTEDVVEKSSKSLWGGRFFGSVDNL
jgi:uncharacterized phage infection (PIP) family protein YhgE